MCIRDRFQTSFFPLFTHVNLNPLAVAFTPTFVHAAPALGVAEKLGWPNQTREIDIAKIVSKRARDRMKKS